MDFHVDVPNPAEKRTTVLWTTRFLTDQDASPLGEVLDEAMRFEGKPRWQLDQGLRQMAVQRLSRQKLTAVSLAILRATAKDKVDWASVRQRRRQAFWDAHRDRSMGSIASFDGEMFADIASERIVRWPDKSVETTQVLQAANEILLRSLLGQSRRLVLQISGSSRRVVRQAALRGLFYSVSDGTVPFEAIIDVSGPLALFQSSKLYAQGLLEVVKASFECSRFKIEIEFETKAGTSTVALDSAMPLSAIAVGKRFDSRVEERMCRDLSATLLDWSVIREPKPVVNNGRLSFPDVLVQHRLRPERKWYLEVVGFWGEAYLRKKVETLCNGGVRPLIVVIDQRLEESFVRLKDEIQAGASVKGDRLHVVKFQRKKLPLAEVLSLIERGRSMSA